MSTAYRMAQTDKMLGAFRANGQWRISVPRFRYSRSTVLAEQPSRPTPADKSTVSS